MAHKQLLFRSEAREKICAARRLWPTPCASRSARNRRAS